MASAAARNSAAALYKVCNVVHTHSYIKYTCVYTHITWVYQLSENVDIRMYKPINADNIYIYIYIYMYIYICR